MRYMRGLNSWLENDVRDRQNEMRSIGARVDALRADLGRAGFLQGGENARSHLICSLLTLTMQVCQAVQRRCRNPAEVRSSVSYRARRSEANVESISRSNVHRTSVTHAAGSRNASAIRRAARWNAYGDAHAGSAAAVRSAWFPSWVSTVRNLCPTAGHSGKAWIHSVYSRLTIRRTRRPTSYPELRRISAHGRDGSHGWNGSFFANVRGPKARGANKTVYSTASFSDPPSDATAGWRSTDDHSPSSLWRLCACG